MSATIIRNGRIIDPANKRDEIADLFIADGKIVDVEIRNPKSEIRNRRDRRARIDRRAWLDRHARAPARAGIQSQGNDRVGARAAAAGGFTTVVCMPNTSPVPDNPGTIAWIKDRAAAARA